MNLAWRGEDVNNNGIMDGGEDISEDLDNDGTIDPPEEDINGNGSYDGPDGQFMVGLVQASQKLEDAREKLRLAQALYQTLHSRINNFSNDNHIEELQTKVQAAMDKKNRAKEIRDQSAIVLRKATEAASLFDNAGAPMLLTAALYDDLIRANALADTVQVGVTQRVVGTSFVYDPLTAKSQRAMLRDELMTSQVQMVLAETKRDELKLRYTALKGWNMGGAAPLNTMGVIAHINDMASDYSQFLEGTERLDQLSADYEKTRELGRRGLTVEHRTDGALGLVRAQEVAGHNGGQGGSNGFTHAVGDPCR